MKIALIVYDNGSHINWFPSNMAYIASALRDEGHDVTIYSQDVYHYPEEHLTEYIDKNDFDVIGLGIIGGYYQYQKMIKISKAIKKAKKKPIYIMGGHGPSPEPEYFLRLTSADYVVVGEGEITIVDLLENLDSPEKVDGIAFINDNDEYIQTKPRDLIKDIDNISYPAYDLFPIDHYALLHTAGFKKTDRSMAMLSGRGCPFTCNFCFRLSKGFRPRSTESIVEEIKYLKWKYDISAIYFADELIMSSKKRTIEICEAFIKEKLDIRWYCNGRLNFATPEVLKVMKKAGCSYLNYGIESIDNQALKNMNKHLTVEQIIPGIENTLKEGITPGLNVIFGNIGETKEILKKGVEFLKKYNTGYEMRSIRPVTPYPGSPLYYYAIEKGLLKDVKEFYEVKHLNSDLLAVNFTNIPDDEFYEALKRANTELINDYYEKNRKNMLKQCARLYNERDPSFRGFRQL